MESFYLHDIRQAHSELEQAGVKPFGAPDFVRYAAHLQASSEKVGEEGLPSKNTNVETVDEEAAAPPESEAFAAPIGAPLARLLACAADEKLPRIDLLKEPFVVADLASPRSLASGRWPTNAAHHLYLCQQAAMAGILRKASDRWSLLTDRREPARAGWCVTLSRRLLFAAHVRSPGKTILERSLMISKA